MNPGGEPERDETGLPPVDIEIPDDARELDRDVQAYYRELRALRRQHRGFRARGSLAKDGIVLPLLACCLILALITGTLLTVFTATSEQNPTRQPVAGNATARPPSASRGASGANGAAPGGTTSAANSPSGPASGGRPPATSQPGTVPGMLPQAIIAVDGQAPMSVHDLTKAALVLIPPHCDCTATVSWLIYVVAGAHAQTYLVYSPESKADVFGVYGGLSSTRSAQVLLALETDDLLSDSIPAAVPAGGPTAILIGPKKTAIYATGLNSRDNATTLIQALTH